jgi:multiple sugar transport system ATP-binding protein
LGITDILGQKPGALSTGQKQRVSLARALVREPSVLLLDEPLSHLDLAQRDRTRREIKRLQEETGYTTVLATHDQLEALSMADRIALMNEGELQQVGTPEEVYDDSANLFVAGFVGDPPMNLLHGRARRTERGMNVSLSDETSLPVANSSMSPDQRVVVGVRPQDIHVVDSDGPDVVRAMVFAFEPLQETGLLTTTLPGVETRIKAETAPRARFSREESVRLRVDPDRIRLFDAESGERIR